MATEKVIKTIFQIRRDTAANWLVNKDVTPAAGEPCFIIDQNILKIGDGVKTFEQLPSIGGIDVSADGNSLIIEDGTFKLLGFDGAAKGAQPRKAEDGTLEWIVPTGGTLEELQTIVADLQTDVSELQTDVANLQAIVGTVEDGAEPLIDRIAALESGVDTLNGDENTEGSVLKTVKDEINAFATNVSDDGVVNSYKELIDYVAEHGSDAANLAAEIAKKVDKVEGKSLVDDTLITKLENIETGAQVNKIEAVKVGETLLDIVDKTVTIPVGAGLKSSDEIAISADGILEIKTISIEKIAQPDEVTIVMDGGSSVI